MSNLYADIARRTGGDIYIGVVGPVRTGKSTFIARFILARCTASVKMTLSPAFTEFLKMTLRRKISPPSWRRARGYP